MTKDPVFRNFEVAFSSRSSGSVRECLCGRVFYNPTGGWDWEDGELESLEKDPNATAVGWSCQTVHVDGREYAMDCTCWHDRARGIIQWLQHHAEEVAEFLTLEKKRKTAEAERAPVVG